MNFLRWGFRSNLTLHQGTDEKSVVLANGEKYSDFVRKLSVIDTSRKLVLNPLLFNGTLQTLYYTSSDTSKKFLVYYGREFFHYSDGGMCSLDWVIPKEDDEVFQQKYTQNLPEYTPRLHPRTRFLGKDEMPSKASPIVVVIHGLAGGSHEPLIRNFAENVHKNTPDWDVVVINSRGCCRTHITSGKLFSAFSTSDIGEVLEALKKKNPHRPLYAVGFSFGAALLSNYLAENSSLVDAACMIGCPWDFVDSSHHLKESWSGTYLFNPALAQFLAKLIKNNLAQMQKSDPELFTSENLNRAFKAKTMIEVDNIFTCKSIGYPNAMQYYRAASPVNFIHKIKTPCLIVNSNDDPTIGVKLPVMEVKSNPYLAMVETDLGGHLGFVKPNGDFWGVEVVEEFFKEFHSTNE